MATSIKLPAVDENISPLPEPKAATETKAHHSRTFWNRQNHESKPVRHLRKEFNGASGRRYPYSFRKPKRELEEKVIETYDKSSTETENGKRAYRNPFNKVIWKVRGR